MTQPSTPEANKSHPPKHLAGSLASGHFGDAAFD